MDRFGSEEKEKTNWDDLPSLKWETFAGNKRYQYQRAVAEDEGVVFYQLKGSTKGYFAAVPMPRDPSAPVEGSRRTLRSADFGLENDR